MENNFPKQGEVWLIDYTFKFSKIESEFETESRIKKLRPSIILSDNIHNQFNDSVFVAPLTSIDTEKFSEALEVEIKKDNENGLYKNSKALIKYISPQSKSRIVAISGFIKKDKMQEIFKKFRDFFGTYLDHSST